MDSPAFQAAYRGFETRLPLQSLAHASRRTKPAGGLRLTRGAPGRARAHPRSTGTGHAHGGRIVLARDPRSRDSSGCSSGSFRGYRAAATGTSMTVFTSAGGVPGSLRYTSRGGPAMISSCACTQFVRVS